MPIFPMSSLKILAALFNVLIGVGVLVAAVRYVKSAPNPERVHAQIVQDNGVPVRLSDPHPD